MSLESLLTVKQVVERCPAITEGGLRWWLFNAESNGLNSAIVRAGGRVFIDVQAFERWLDRDTEERSSEGAARGDSGGA